LNLLQEELNEGILIPLVGFFHIVDQLLLLLLSISHEIKEIHVALVLTDDQAALITLNVDLEGSTKIIVVTKSSERQRALHLSEALTDHLINKVTLDWTVVARSCWTSTNLQLILGCLDSCSFLKLFDLELLKHDELVHLIVLILTILDSLLQKLSLVIK
jgi:hypothetical protein